MPKRIALPLLLVAVLFSVALPGNLWVDPLDDPLQLLFDPEQAFTFEGALAIAERLDRIGDQLEAPPLPSSSTDLALMAYEIVPYYWYDGIVKGRQVMPPVTWQYFSAEGNFHTLGKCRVGENPSVYINVRYANPWSTWYGKSSLFATLVHELGHAQDIYLFGDPLMEPATQLATVEVLAAMSRDRNPWAFPAFVRELQGYAEDYAWSKALQNGRMGEFEAYLARVGDGVFTAAKYDRAMDYWSGNMYRLKQILKNYGETPYILLVSSINAPGYESQILKAVPNNTGRIVANDTAWTIQHLYEMAREYPVLLEGYEEKH